jgi:competence protein ComEA
MFTAYRRPLRLACELALSLVLLAGLSTVASAQSLVNINTAGVDELRTLPGIGPRKAEAIIEYRESNGPFASTSEITNVSGIGQRTFENIQDMITVGDGTVAGSTSAGGDEDDGPEFQAEPMLDLTRSPGGSAADGAAGGDDEPEDDGDGAASASDGLVNINVADMDELQTLPGIGPAKARAIIEYREANGPFQSVDQLENVSGIGARTVERLRSMATVQ